MAAPTLPTLAQLQSRFDNATNGLYPHYSWVPPVWDNTTSEAPKLEDTVAEAPQFTPGKHPLSCPNLTVFKGRLDKLKSKYGNQLSDVLANRDVETSPNSESDTTLKRVPHPQSDFSHVDKVFDPAKHQLLHQAAKKIKDLMDDDADRDGELSFVYSQIAPPLNQAVRLLEDQPKGMQRLKLVFEWTLCQATTIFGEINAALEDAKDNSKDKKRAQNDYEQARIKFLELLKDLDDHEPQTKGKPQPSPGMNGYGLAVKWAYILPLIHEGKIKGAKIVAKWNPHVSSSGIPLPH